MKAYYLVDSENVNDNWLMLSELAKDDDEIIIFYTPKSPHMSYPNLVRLLTMQRQFRFIECFEGSNGLDFQLVSELGYLICREPDAEYNIMSNDSGFDVVVNYWKRRGCQVRRINVKYCKLQVRRIDEAEPETVALPPAAEPPLLEVKASSLAAEAALKPEEAILKPADAALKSEEAALEADEPALPVMKEAFDKAQVDVIINCLGSSKSTETHNALVHLYGAKQARKIYKRITEKSYVIEPVEWKREEKIEKYCEVVVENSHMDKPVAARFANFLLQNEAKCKNLNSLRPAIMKEYGKELGMKLYSLYKPHVKTIVSIS